MDELVHILHNAGLHNDIGLLRVHFGTEDGPLEEFLSNRDEDRIINELVGRYTFSRECANLIVRHIHLFVRDMNDED